MQGHYEEGGWGWILLLSSFMEEVIVFGNVKALGVMAETISREFETDLWLTGWMISMSLAVQLLTAPLLLPLLRIFGCRPILLVAGVVATIGYLYAAAVSRSFVGWSISIIAFAGIGSGCFCYVIMSVLATYFKKYYPSVVLISTLGMSLGTMVYGPMTQVLLDTYGWRWAMAILAALTFHLVPCAAVARKSKADSEDQSYRRISQVAEDRNDAPENSETDEKNWCGKLVAALDLAIFTDVHFVLLTLASCVVAFCFVGWAVYVVPHGIHQGLTPTQSSFLPTLFGVGNITGKVAASLMMQLNVLAERWIMCVGALLASGFFILDPFVGSFASLLLVTMAIGTGNAICNMAKFVMYRNMTSDKKLISVYSWHALFVGLSEVISGFASGWFFKVTGSFTTTFIMFGVVQFVAVISLILDYVIASCRKKL